MMAGCIWVDADACAVKSEVYKVAMRHGWRVWVVANQYIQTPQTDRIMCLVVAQGPDCADDLIAERVTAADVVITDDIVLASRCLAKKAAVLGQRGKEFTEDSIGDALAGRELANELREMGVMSAGPKPIAQKDRSRFLGKLDQLLVARRGAVD